MATIRRMSTREKPKPKSKAGKNARSVTKQAKRAVKASLPGKIVGAVKKDLARPSLTEKMRKPTAKTISKPAPAKKKAPAVKKVKHPALANQIALPKKRSSNKKGLGSGPVRTTNRKASTASKSKLTGTNKPRAFRSTKFKASRNRGR